MLFEWYFCNYCLIRKIRGDNYHNLYRNLFERKVLRYPQAYQLASLRFLYTVLKLSWGCPTPFYLLSHISISSATELISSCRAALPPRQRRGAWGYAIHTVRHHKIMGAWGYTIHTVRHHKIMVSEVWIAYRKALSPIGVGRFAGWQGSVGIGIL